jgi:hypothetical protein
MATILGTMPVDIIQDRTPKRERAYSWEVIDAPDAFWLGRIFRKLDITITAKSGDWPNGIVFQHVESKKMLVYWNGQILDLPSLSSAPRDSLKENG